ncbi:uncharacterized protein PFL1_00915 [Pseudozyma flocculosa PF-1]|uniref:Secreted protein n=1 Tax=Pseudozyma flocculosa TaxID=84751 RepID=A0A5C3F4K8_9BASI|nr:uncharacterized protein PFL1_00915 [Pseudozyma flocculosa PF-1]EPQ31582.1 hypothetical protein PFL1_00915 [Pseudozyma flocculosa PF-1]SPO38627.1 uncharacterized protein PSFLO_04106 [Pseudozyma flocculosa]
MQLTLSKTIGLATLFGALLLSVAHAQDVGGAQLLAERGGMWGAQAGNNDAPMRLGADGLNHPQTSSSSSSSPAAEATQSASSRQSAPPQDNANANANAAASAALLPPALFAVPLLAITASSLASALV